MEPTPLSVAHEHRTKPVLPTLLLIVTGRSTSRGRFEPPPARRTTRIDRASEPKPRSGCVRYRARRFARWQKLVGPPLEDGGSESTTSQERTWLTTGHSGELRNSDDTLSGNSRDSRSAQAVPVSTDAAKQRGVEGHNRSPRHALRARRRSTFCAPTTRGTRSAHGDAPRSAHRPRAARAPCTAAPRSARRPRAAALRARPRTTSARRPCASRAPRPLT
jgi:hypothetical protein